MEQRPPRLEEKVAIVTGAGSSGPGVGTGKATSILFAREGAKVLLVDRVAQHATDTLTAIRGEGGEATVFEADITKAEACQAMVEAAIEGYGGLHILMNNVGIVATGTVVDVKEEDWDRVLEVNLKGMMLSSKYAIPKMMASGAALSSTSLLSMPYALAPSQPPSLHGLQRWSDFDDDTFMAVQHGRDNIRVNCIAPGFLYTPIVAPLITEEMRELRRQAAPLGTQGTAWDVAWAAVFLASDEARWITGIVLPVDAGLLATTPLSMLSYLRQV
jgi:NAD(P)-dependent dehydrogenase (short-subunit alcohol dehydrogenase family)